MNRTEYKNNFGREHYERINLVVPKGMKDIIKTLASSKGMSINAYMQDLLSFLNVVYSLQKLFLESLILYKFLY